MLAHPCPDPLAVLVDALTDQVHQLPPFDHALMPVVVVDPQRARVEQRQERGMVITPKQIPIP